MNSASRGYRGPRAEGSRRSDEAEAASQLRGATVLVADDESFSDELQIEFDRRVARLGEEHGGASPFRLAAFDGESSSRDPGEETLAQTFADAGSMPPDVAEECVRGLLVALASAHAARWSHGELSLDSFALDASGRVSLADAGRRQRSAWFDSYDGADPQTFGSDGKQELDRRWSEAFLDFAADDVRRLTNEIVPSLSQAMDGSAPAWFERLRTRLDALDGTIATVDDLEHAWRVIDAAFETNEAPPEIATEPISEEQGASVAPDSPIDETAQDLPQPALADASSSSAMSATALLWLCVAGGLAAIAGAMATAIVRL